MNPGMAEIGFDNNAAHKKARRTMEGNGGHFTQFLRIPNNQGTWSLLLPPTRYGSFKSRISSPAPINERGRQGGARPKPSSGHVQAVIE
jgi:hypothetical protein